MNYFRASTYIDVCAFLFNFMFCKYCRASTYIQMSAIVWRRRFTKTEKVKIDKALKFLEDVSRSSADGFDALEAAKAMQKAVPQASYGNEDNHQSKDLVTEWRSISFESGAIFQKEFLDFSVFVTVQSRRDVGLLGVHDSLLESLHGCRIRVRPIFAKSCSCPVACHRKRVFPPSEQW